MSSEIQMPGAYWSVINESIFFYFVGPVNGGWSAWTPWICSCSHLTGMEGSKTTKCVIKKSRSCSNPPPSNYGLHCIGDNEEVYPNQIESTSNTDSECKEFVSNLNINKL